jgi:hypothetical protein
MKSHYLKYVLALTLFLNLKGFAQTPYDWPFINTDLTNKLDSMQMMVRQKWSGGNYCTQFAGSLTLASTNRGYSLWTPHPPGPLDPTWQNTLLGQIDTELIMMDSLGYKAIDMDVEYPTLIDTFPNSQLYMSFEKRVFAMAKSMGFKTIINCHTLIPGEYYAARDLDSFYYRPNGKPDTMRYLSYLKTKLQMLQTIIDSLAPDYLTLLEEPQAEYANLYGLVPFPADSSRNYVEYWLGNLHAHGTPLGAGAGTWDMLKFFEDFASTNIDYMDYHVYPIEGTCLFPTVFQVDSIAQANNKPLIIGECWAHKCTDSDWQANPSISYWKDTFFIGDDFSYFENIDTLFVQTMVNLSQLANVQLVDFWNTQNEFGYLNYGPTYYNMSGPDVENIADSVRYANMYKEQLGPLGVFTKKAVAKINAACLAGVNTIQSVNDEISIYPNPATNQLFVTFSGNVQAMEVDNVLGETIKKVKTGNNQNRVAINVSSLSPGVYFIRLVTSNGYRVKKLVKE